MGDLGKVYYNGIYVSSGKKPGGAISTRLAVFGNWLPSPRDISSGIFERWHLDDGEPSLSANPIHAIIRRAMAAVVWLSNSGPASSAFAVGTSVACL